MSKDENETKMGIVWSWIATQLAYDNTITVLNAIGVSKSKKIVRAVETVRREVLRLVADLETSKPSSVKETERKQGKNE